MLKKTLLYLLFLFILTQCGFKTVNLDINYNVVEINTAGDNRINFKIKNKILNNSKKNSENFLKVEIDTKKRKIIKEKNISNEITKYEIIITTNIKFFSINEKKGDEFRISKSGSYNVSNKYSDTLSNEKSLIDTLLNELNEEILEDLVRNLNDL